MKNFKKILSYLTCLVFVFIFAFSISACDVKENDSKEPQSSEQTTQPTETITTKMYDLDEAKQIYANAVNNLFSERNYKLSINRIDEEEFVLTKTNIEFISCVKNNKVYWYEKIDDGNNIDEVLAGNYNDVICEIDLKNNTYVEYDSFQKIEMQYNNLPGAFINLKDKVVSAKKVNGVTIVNIEDIGNSVDRNDTYYEFKIVDNKIIGLSSTYAEYHSYLEEMYTTGWIDINITYDDFDTTKIVTSLDGFTKA